MPAVTRIELSGPRTLAPGQTASFKATAIFADGSSGDVTAKARWSSNSVARIEAPGQFTGSFRGDATITVEFNGLTSVMHVIVVPEGTYRVSGVVRVSTDVGPGIAGALVEVLGAPERIAGSTDVEGKYVLFGVPGNARIRVTRSGYGTLEDAVRLTEHQTVDFVFTLSRPLPDLSGTYTLRITLSTPCGDTDPGPEFRDRTYRATITHTSPTALDIRLTGAQMVVSSGYGDRFSGTAEPSGASFNIDPDNYAYSYPEVVELLPDGTHLVFGGSASTMLVVEGLVGTMRGWVHLYRQRPSVVRPFASCWSDTIRFALLK